MKLIRISRNVLSIDTGIFYLGFMRWTIGNYFGCTNGWYFEWRLWGFKWRGQYKLTNRDEHYKVNQIK